MSVPARPMPPRMVETLGLMAEGYSNAVIGQKLGITRETAKMHVSRVIEHLEARNRVHAVALAYQQGLLPTGDQTT